MQDTRPLLGTMLTLPVMLFNLSPAMADGPLFSRAGGISAPGATPSYSIDSTGSAAFRQVGTAGGIALGGTIDTAGNAISGGTPSTAPTVHTLNLSCLPNGFPGGAANVRNHAELCIEGIANKYSNNGIYVNGVPQTGPNAYNDNDYMVTLGLDVQRGSNNPVGLFDFAQGEAGAPGFWAVNSVTQLQPGFTNSAFGYELDFNNNSGTSSNNNIGLWITGASQYPNLVALQVTGVTANQWHFGFMANTGVDTAGFIDQSQSSDAYVAAGSHGGSGLKLKTGLFATSAIDLATDPTSGKNTLRWSDQNNGGYGIFTIGVDRTTEADTATALAFNLPAGNATFRYDGSLTLATTAGGGNLTVPGSATIGTNATINGNMTLAPGKSFTYRKTNGYTYWYHDDTNGVLNYVSNASNAVQLLDSGSVNVLGTLTAGSVTSSGNVTLGDSKSVVFTIGTAGSNCLLFHDDNVSGLVYQCGSVRLMRIPDNGGAPIFKTAPVAGTP